jgi:chemotaxis protein histidine kinase CheA
MNELISHAVKLGQLAFKIGSELHRAQPGSDDGLFPLNCLLGELEDLAGSTGGSEKITPTLEHARQWVDRTFERGTFDLPTLQRLQAWAAWLKSASQALQAGEWIEAFSFSETAKTPSHEDSETVPATPVNSSIGKARNSSIEDDPELLMEFTGETHELLREAESSLDQLAAERSSDSVEGFFRCLHTLKGSAGSAGFEGIQQMAHHLESMLELVRKGTLKVSEELIHMLRCGIQVLRRSTNELTGAVEMEPGSGASEGREKESVESVSISEMCRRMERMAREIGAEQGKQVEVICSGAERRIHPRVAKALREILLHLVRNAVDHGLELPRARVQQGKLPQGRIALKFSRRAGNLHVRVEDDGAGIRLEQVLAKAVERGLIRPGQKLAPGKVRELLFAPGFSTAGKVSELSGRGVGLDAVRHAVVGLGGTIGIRSGGRAGCAFLMRLPCPD